MTQNDASAVADLPQELVVTQLLWHDGKWLQPGTAFVIDRNSVKQVQAALGYLAKGFIADPEDVERQRNPEAARAKAEAARTAERVNELTAQLSQSREREGTLRDQLRRLEQEVQDLKALAPDAEEVARLGKLRDDVLGILQTQLTAEDLAGDTQPTPVDVISRLIEERDRLKAQLQAAPAASGADADALARYREVVGDLLPQGDLTDAAYRSLLAGGYYTAKLVQAASDTELKKLPDVDAATISKLRAAYPRG